MTERALTLKQRFDSKWLPEPNTGCWLWLGGAKGNGYGSFSAGRSQTAAAHRWGWMLYRGPIPEGMQIDHLCRVRACVNPDHLRVVTPRQNALENTGSRFAANLLKTHCPKGHPYAGANLKIRKDDKFTRRVCRTCSHHRQPQGTPSVPPSATPTGSENE